MQLIKSQSHSRFRCYQKIIRRKQKFIGLSRRNQKKRSLCFRNCYWSLSSMHQSHYWSFSYLRRNLVRRSLIRLIIQTRQWYVEISRQNQKSSFLRRCYGRFSLISQQRLIRRWSHVRLSQKYVKQLQRQSRSWILIRCCRWKRRHCCL